MKTDSTRGHGAIDVQEVVIVETRQRVSTQFK